MMPQRLKHKTSAPKNYLEWPPVLLDTVEQLRGELAVRSRYGIAICLIQLIIHCLNMLRVLDYSSLEIRKWYKELQKGEDV